MTRSPLRRAARWGTLALAPLLLAPGVLPADGAVGDRQANGWARLNDSDFVPDAVRPGVAQLSDGSAMVAWRDGVGAPYSLMTSKVSASNVPGAPRSRLSWDLLNPDPAVLPHGQGGAEVVHIGAGGDHSSVNAYRLLVDADGVAQQAPPSERYFVAGAGASEDMPLDTDRRGGGEAVVVQMLRWHAGLVQPSESQDAFFEDRPPLTFYTGASVATAGAASYLAYFAYGNNDVGRGLYVARLLPTAQPRQLLPGSWYTGDLVALEGSTTGVLWAAYCTGQEACEQLVLHDVLGNRTLTVPTGEYAARIALSPAPGGRMWVAWQSGSSAISAARTNKAGTQFGPVRRSAPFYTENAIETLAMDGSRGAADVVLNGRSAIWHRRYLVPLSASASPAKWKVNRRQTVKFTVRDAGDAVGGATVTLVGRTCTTGSTGVCSIVVPARSAPATLTATVTGSTYQPASLQLRVVR